MKKLKGASVVKCRVCKGDHWTKKCPYRESLQPLKEIEEKEKEKAKDNGAFVFIIIKNVYVFVASAMTKEVVSVSHLNDVAFQVSLKLRNPFRLIRLSSSLH